jgi:predicted RND superfamily exporter protein
VARASFGLRLFSAYVAFAERRTRTLLLVLLGVMVAALACALRLDLHTEISELLPDDAPAVMALRRIAGRQKSASNLVILIHGGSDEEDRRMAEALRAPLETMVPRLFTEVQWHPDRELPEFARRWKWLYADVNELDNVESLLDRLIARHSQPAFVDLEGDPEAELERKRATLDEKLPKAAREGRYFEAVYEGRHFVGILLWRRMEGLATRGDLDTLKEVQAVVARVGAARAPGVQVEYTGGIAQAIDEQNGIRDDLTLATALCGTFVLLAIYSYFRRVALLWVIGAPAVLGVLLSLSIASLTIHYLNLNTAFLMSIILGNGINSPIILLGRYREERERGEPVGVALAQAMNGSVAGVGAAVLAASVAYGSLSWTSFRGFNQFGLLGGAGMLLVGLMTFILVPPLILYGERRWPGALTPRRNLWRVGFSYLGELAARRPRQLAAAGLVLLALAALPLGRWARDPLEWNFENLRTENTSSQRLWGTMEAVGIKNVGSGYVGNNGVLIVDDPAEADPVAAALEAQDAARGAQHVLKGVHTLHSMLPGDQPEKLEILSRIRGKIDKHKDLLDEGQRRDVEAFRPPDELRALTVGDLPRLILDAFTEVDGHVGRLVGVDADHQTYSDWNGHDLMRMANALQVTALGKHWVAASPATIFAGLIDTIVKDGPRVTLLAAVGVLGLLLLAFGPRGAAPVAIAIAVGMMWLGGLSGLFGLKLNFMSYVALPITLGVGADYAANIWARLRTDGVGRMRAVIADTGSAVALCSLTTVIGYSSLLVSHNRALRSFGLLADLGEVCCLGAALLVLPPLARVFAGARPLGAR